MQADLASFRVEWRPDLVTGWSLIGERIEYLNAAKLMDDTYVAHKGYVRLITQRVLEPTEVDNRIGYTSKDRDDVHQLERAIKEAIDRAHWLAVQRQMSLASFIEEFLKPSLRLTRELSGRQARKEKL